MRQLLCTLTMIALLLPGVTRAQEQSEPLRLSIDEAMEFAVKNNIKAKNARLDIEKQKAVNAQVSGLALPNIKGKGEFNDYINVMQSFVPAEFVGGPPGTFIPVPFMPKFTSTASVSGSQLLFDGSVMVALQARKALVKLFEQSAALTDQEIKYNILKAYQAIVVSNRQIKILDEGVAFSRSISYELNAMYDAGFVEKIEADRVTVQLNNLITDSIKTHNMLDVSVQMLKYQLGIPNEQSILLTDTSVEEQIKDAQLLLLEDLNFANRADYNALQTQLKLNQYDVKRYRMAALPSLAAFGTAAYTYSTNKFADIFNKQYIFYSMVGLQLNVPIFDGMQRRNQVKEAKITLMQTENNIENLELGMKLQKNVSSTQLRNAILAMESQERNLRLAKTVLETSVEKYKAGVGTSLEVAQAQTEMILAQSNYFQALLEAANTKADLRKALGEF